MPTKTATKTTAKKPPRTPFDQVLDMQDRRELRMFGTDLENEEMQEKYRLYRLRWLGGNQVGKLPRPILFQLACDYPCFTRFPELEKNPKPNHSPV